MAMLARKFKRAFKKGGSKYKKFLKKYTPKDKRFKDSKEEVVCYECHKLGHIKPKCPLLKKKKGKEDRSKKAMKVVWSNSEESSNDESSDKETAHLCMMAFEEKVESSQKEEESDNEVCFKGMKESEKWYVYSGCSKHMTGEKDKFSKITMVDGGHVKFGDKEKGKIIGNGTIRTKPCIEDVSLVEGLKYNLLSVSQLCDKGFEGMCTRKAYKSIF
ncbi:uncharacterized protein LOC131175914 [Hevea brasiliensis]|uniref:uncharacterized protein LOC131175914 n=1 Tax=Hevea brasiliensis TaxID=3981 RepID=UPI0025F2A989|nr:uncharacterized protein LOC131175914 [Hevea brasiliensis]